MTTPDFSGLERIYQRKAGRVHQLYLQRRESLLDSPRVLDEMLQREERYADAQQDLYAFLGILLSAGEILRPEQFDRYAPSILKIFQGEPFICYAAGLRWSTENFTRYAAPLGEGITSLPRLCYKMICDLFTDLDPSASDKNLLEKCIRESFLSLEPWEKRRIRAISDQLEEGLVKDSKLVQRVVLRNYQPLLERMQTIMKKYTEVN